jgi:hypothetical protein
MVAPASLSPHFSGEEPGHRLSRLNRARLIKGDLCEQAHPLVCFGARAEVFKELYGARLKVKARERTHKQIKEPSQHRVSAPRALPEHIGGECHEACLVARVVVCLSERITKGRIER